MSKSLSKSSINSSVSAICSVSLGLRLWHWLNAIVVIGLLATFFLRDTLFSVRANQKAFIETLADSEITIDEGAAKDLARGLVDKLWEWHVTLGYVLAGLFFFRLLLFAAERSSSHIFSARRRRGGAQGLMIQLLHFTFYVAEMIMVLSGLAMVFDEKIGLRGGFRHFIGEVHENVMWFFVAFIVMHVAGVVRSENTDEPGLVSSMINGGKRVQ